MLNSYSLKSSSCADTSKEFLVSVREKAFLGNETDYLARHLNLPSLQIVPGGSETCGPK